MKCCINCFSELEIQNYIELIDELGNCDYCKGINVNIADVADVGEFIREGVKQAYESIDDGTGAIYDSELKEYSEEGQKLDEILYWELSIFSENYSYEMTQELCEDLIKESGPSFSDIKHGENDWLANEHLVFKDALYGEEVTKEHISWENFKYTCKYLNRYFDLGGRKSARAKILSDLNDV